MSNTYTWVVDSLDCIPSQDGQANVVSCVHWRVNATSAETKTITTINNTIEIVPMYETSIYGAQSLNYTVGAPFTPYSELTKNTVIGWAQKEIGDEQIVAIYESLDNKIANLINPLNVNLPLPFTN